MKLLSSIVRGGSYTSKNIYIVVIITTVQSYFLPKFINQSKKREGEEERRKEGESKEGREGAKSA